MTCNQCQEKLGKVDTDYTVTVNNIIKVDTVNFINWVCINIKCPNFGLLQIPHEEMYKYWEEKKKNKDDWHMCYECGVKKYGKPPEESMEGITVMAGKCPVCGKKKTLIPIDDFIGQGD